MADYNTDQKKYKKICEKYGITLRASIDPKSVEKGNFNQIETSVKDLLSKCAGTGGFIFGCGIVSYTTKPESVIINLKELIIKNNPYL